MGIKITNIASSGRFKLSGNTLGRFILTTLGGGGGSFSQGPNNGGTATQDLGSPDQFTNLNNILGNTNYAQVTVTPPNPWLSSAVDVSNFGFSIPNGATINGIEVSLTAYVVDTSGVSTLFIPQMDLFLGATTYGTQFAASPSNTITSSTPTVFTFGGPTSKFNGNGPDWNGSTMTPSIINNSSFRVNFFAQDDEPDSTITLFVKNLTMKVYYTT